VNLNLPVQQSTSGGSISGAVNGTNRTFTLSGVQPTGVDLFWNGVFQTNGIDYTWSANTLTMISGPPNTGDILTARVWTQ
jgi:hypothetical protein